MSQTTRDGILEALKGVKDPDRNDDIVALGMISGLQVKDGHVAFSIEVEPERGAQLEPLRKEAEKAVHALPGILTVSAVLTAERAAPEVDAPPAPGPGGAPGIGGAPNAGPGAGTDEPFMPNIGFIIAVASGKGGVGKSTTAVNLALGMAQNGLAVGILDADVYGPSVPRLLGLAGQTYQSDGPLLAPMENYGIKCMSIGFLVEEDNPVIWRGPMATSALNQLLGDVNWGVLDALIVDLPPGTGDIHLTMVQQIPLAGAVIVSTPQDIALADARKGLNMFRKVDVPVLGIIENMSYFLCPDNGKRYDIFGHGGARLEAQRLGVDFLGEIPLDMIIRKTSDEGIPIVHSDPANEHAKVYKEIAGRVWNSVVEAREEGSDGAPKIVVQ